MRNIFFIFLFSYSCFLNAQLLKGTEWLLASIDNIEAGKSKPAGEKFKISLRFDSDTTYSGTGCNTYSGTYKSEKNNLAMSKSFSVGLEKCLGLGNFEMETISLYPKATRYRVEADKLFIFTSDDYRLCFKKQ